MRFSVDCTRDTSKVGRVSCEKTTFLVVFKFPGDDSSRPALWEPRIWEELYVLRGVRKLSVLIKIGSAQFLYTIAVAFKIVYTHSPMSTLRKVANSAYRLCWESLTPRTVGTVDAF